MWMLRIYCDHYRNVAANSHFYIIFSIFCSAPRHVSTKSPMNIAYNANLKFFLKLQVTKGEEYWPIRPWRSLVYVCVCVSLLFIINSWQMQSVHISDCRFVVAFEKLKRWYSDASFRCRARRFAVRGVDGDYDIAIIRQFSLTDTGWVDYPLFT